MRSLVEARLEGFCAYTHFVERRGGDVRGDGSPDDERRLAHAYGGRVEKSGLDSRERDDRIRVCPVPLTVRGTQALVSFAPLAFKLFCAARQNAVLRRSPFPPV